MNPLKSERVKRLESISGVEHKTWPERQDGFSTLLFNEKEIGHFHNFNELDLRLGKTLIQQEGLSHHPDSVYHPKRSKQSQFVELRFNTPQDLDRIVELVQLLVAQLS